MKRLSAMLLAAGCLSGCALLPRGVQMGSPEGGWGSKIVAFKEEPATLVARDGTLCTVTASKFQNAKEGDRVWCHWRARGSSFHPGPTGPGG